MKFSPARQHKDYFWFLICSLSVDNQLSLSIFLQNKTLTKTLILMLFTKHHKNKHRTFSFCLNLIVNSEKQCPYCPCLPREFFVTLCEINQTQDKYFHFCKDSPDWKTKTNKNTPNTSRTKEQNCSPSLTCSSCPLETLLWVSLGQVVWKPLSSFHVSLLLFYNLFPHFSPFLFFSLIFSFCWVLKRARFLSGEACIQSDTHALLT